MLLHAAEGRGGITGIRVARNASSITHLFLQMIAFCSLKRAVPAEAEAIKDCLSIYEKCSGKEVNFEKSGISFSINTIDVTKKLLACFFGVSQTDDFGKYLGVPSVIGKNKRHVLKFVEDKLRSRLGGWNKKFLSKAGKEILLKTVAQALPTYTRSVFLLPMTSCYELEILMN